MDGNAAAEAEVRRDVQSVISAMTLRYGIISRLDPKVDAKPLRDGIWEITLRTANHPSIEKGGFTKQVRHSPSGQDGRRILGSDLEAYFAEIARIERRARAIRDSGEDVPLWAYFGDEVLVGMTAHEQVDLAKAISEKRNQKSNVGLDSAMTIQGDRNRATHLFCKLKIRRDILVTTNLFITRSEGGDVLRYNTMEDEGRRVGVLHFKEVAFSEAVLMSLAGRPLAEVVGHPGLTGVTAPIVSAEQDGDGVRIRIERRIRAFAPLPGGIDQGWLPDLDRVAAT